MKKKVLFIFEIVFLIFLLLFLAISQLQVVQATIASGEAIKGIGPLPPCPPGVSERLDYTETDKKGNKVEVFCDGGQYRMKFTPAGGGEGYVGKCPFPWGQNMPAKKVSISINSTDNSTTVEEILKTFWISFDAPAPGVGVTGTNKPDRIWVYDSRTKKYIRQNTLHDGGWVTGADGNLSYNVTRVAKDGNSTPPADAPANPDDLTVMGDPPPEEYLLHEVYTPVYALYTPTPVTSIDEYGNIETNVYKIPYGKELVIERIEAVVNQPFSFDIEMPGEKAELVNYFLISAPMGMNINPNTGVIHWIPNMFQLGYNNVAVMIRYPGLNPDIDQFMLQVLLDYDGDSDGDGILDRNDNCPTVPNPDQADSNQNGIGDACEGGVCNYNGICESWIGEDFSSCPSDCVLEQDLDGDGIPDAQDNCPTNSNPDQSDIDNDGIGDACDNCPNPNPDQVDCNSNGIGDVCDIANYISNDCNNNNIPDECDIASDNNHNGIPDECEYVFSEIPLDQGWNLISIPLILENNQIENVFGNIMDKVIVINGFESGPGGGAKTYDPLLPEFSDLHNIDYLHGYWVKMNQSATLMVIGLVPENKIINLETNWNLISYLSDIPRATSDVISPITSKVIVVNGFENGALTYDPLLPEFSDLQVIKPNLGYWLKMSAPGVLDYTVTSEETYTCCLNNFDATCFQATIENCRAQNGAVMECIPASTSGSLIFNIVNYTKVNTTSQSGWLRDLTDAVKATGISNKTYVPGTFDCDDFADFLEKNLTASGYDATYTIYWWINASGQARGHAVTDVHAPDGSLVFIDPQTGKIVDLDFDGDGKVEAKHNEHTAGFNPTDDGKDIEVYDSAAAAAAAGAPRD